MSTDEKQLIEQDISHEEWREYDFAAAEGYSRIYRINHPKTLYYYPGDTTHRVVDTKGIEHCVPAPGIFGCVIRWCRSVEKPPLHKPSLLDSGMGG